MRKLRKDEDESVQWTAEDNLAVQELLDHVARQLAEEYVRLMKGPHSVYQQPKEGERKK